MRAHCAPRTSVASYQLQRAPMLLECRCIPIESARRPPRPSAGAITKSARSHPTEWRGTLTDDARKLLDHWSPLLAKEGISRARNDRIRILPKRADFHDNSFGIFYVPQICNTGPTALLHAEEFYARKKPTASAGFEPAILGNAFQNSQSTPYLTFHNKKGLHNMRNLPETPIIFLVYSPKSYFLAFLGPF
jgi:hypothetical protein